MTTEKTHYRKAFDSPYLSSADITGPTILTIRCVRLEPDHTKKTKDQFNTAYFAEKELRPGETLKPMILNATNSRTLKKLAGSPFIDDWNNIPVTIYVDNAVKFGRDTVEGLRIKPEAAKVQKPELLPGTPQWSNAIAAYKRDGNLEKVKVRVSISEQNEMDLIAEATQ
jgi:hypothetical protein